MSDVQVPPYSPRTLKKLNVSLSNLFGDVRAKNKSDHDDLSDTSSKTPTPKHKPQPVKSESAERDGDVSGLWFEQSASNVEQKRIQRMIEDMLLGQVDQESIFQLSDALPLVNDGARVIVEDDFSRCFLENPTDKWNWNTYLFVLYNIGVAIRYCILFPLRLLSLLLGFLVFIISFESVIHFVKNEARRAELQRKLIRFLCGVFVFSWTGVIKYHGIIPKHKPNQIYVANHSSMIDMIILSQMHTFSVVGQKHPGWVGWAQDHLLGCLKCVWFERKRTSDRAKSAQIIREHIKRSDTNRLLIFPEGTCVNNQYIVQFKKGAFDMGATVCPIAIKYNKIFVDGYWNSRAMSFLMHLVKLMTSWAVVCDVWYLEPQTRRPDETAIQFAERVKLLIAEQAGLKPVHWDGYLKYFQPSQRFVQKRQKLFADSILRKFKMSSNNTIEWVAPTPHASRAPASPARDSIRQRKPADIKEEADASGS